MSGWGMSITGLAETIDLFREIQMQWSGDTLYVAGPTVKYAVYQELGTSQIEARPFMGPAAERVQANAETHAQQMAASQGINIASEDGLVRALALAVQNEGKRIANQKGVRDTGALIASISIERVQ
jgi:hypothetical protein